MALRYYQQEAITACYQFFKAHPEPDKNCLIIMPTGSGKSHVISGLIETIVNDIPNLKFMILAHKKELLEQNAKKFSDYIQSHLGFYCAGLKKKETDKQIILASIQSIHNVDPEIWGKIDVILSDEAHLISMKEDSTYQKFFAGIRNINPRVRIAGFTATAYRLDCGSLVKGKNALFSDIAYEADLVRLIEEGYLSPIISKDSKFQIDTSNLKHRGGEFLQADVEGSFIPHTEAQVADILLKAKERKSGIIFTSGIVHAETVGECLEAKGESFAIVTGKTPKKQRTEALEAFEEGTIRWLINCDVLTTGYDAPNIDLVVLLRATESTGLYVQMVGRGLRLCPERNKVNCLVLDYGENIKRHGAINNIKINAKSGSAEKTAGRYCKECATYYEKKLMHCPDCGSPAMTRCSWCDFPVPLFERVKLTNCPNCSLKFGYKEIGTTENSDLDIVLIPDNNGEFIFNVTNLQYFIHTKNDVKTLKISIGVKEQKKSINLFLFPEGGENSKLYCRNFFGFWSQESGFLKDAILTGDKTIDFYNFITKNENQLLLPKKILCKKKGDYFNVSRFLFDKESRKTIQSDLCQVMNTANTALRRM